MSAMEGSVACSWASYRRSKTEFERAERIITANALWNTSNMLRITSNINYRICGIYLLTKTGECPEYGRFDGGYAAQVGGCIPRRSLFRWAQAFKPSTLWEPMSWFSSIVHLWVRNAVLLRKIVLQSCSPRASRELDCCRRKLCLTLEPSRWLLPGIFLPFLLIISFYIVCRSNQDYLYCYTCRKGPRSGAFYDVGRDANPNSARRFEPPRRPSQGHRSSFFP